MQIRITGRHFGLTEDIRELIAQRTEKLEKFYNKIVEAHVVIDREDNRYLTEVTLKTQKTQLHAEDEEYDIFASIHATMDKIERQIRRRKSKTKDRKHKTPHREVAVQLSEYEKSETMESEEKSGPSIVKVDDKFALKPISLEEAVLELELSEDNFLMFMNSKTEQVNLLFLQDDGNYGWVEPEFG